MLRKLLGGLLLHLPLILLVTLTPASHYSVNGFASKKIPDHLMKRFPLVDPNRKHVPQHDINIADFEPPVLNPHVRKTHEDVPREPEHTIHVEEMHEDDHEHHERFHGAAKAAHTYSIRKRERMDREERQKERVKNGTAHLPDEDDSWKHHEDPKKIPKPTQVPSREDLHKSIISVFFRDKWSGKHKDDEDNAVEKWMSSNMMAIEAELRDHNVNYQELYLPDLDHVQLICNDPEEREHIKHLLIRQQAVLCFFLEGKMIFGKWPAEYEKEDFKGDREYHRRKRKEEERKRLKQAKAAREAADRAEQEPADHTDL